MNEYNILRLFLLQDHLYSKIIIYSANHRFIITRNMNELTFGRGMRICSIICINRKFLDERYLRYKLGESEIRKIEAVTIFGRYV